MDHRTRRDHAESIFRAALDAVRPDLAVERSYPLISGRLAAARRIVVVGAGKAGAGMTVGLERQLGHLLEKTIGVVNVPDQLAVPTARIRLHASRPTGANEPTEAARIGVGEMLQLLDAATADDAAVILLSGGASALLPFPVPGVSIRDKVEVTRLLAGRGATIAELNCVRKRLSQVKGGQLAVRAGRLRTVDALIISDVPGDPLDVIASGPTVPDPTTFADAWTVLEKYALTAELPGAALEHIRAGVAGGVVETPKTVPSCVNNWLIASNRIGLAAARRRATQLGFAVTDLGSAITGEAQVVAKRLAEMVRTAGPAPRCVVFGGETTVTLSPESGRGGRNMELALALALELGEPFLARATVLCAGSDGEDGPTDAAGAVLDAEKLATGRACADPRLALTRHDTYPWLDRAGALLKTGLTGTNVMDFGVVLVT
jgi:hydroxypyruvate reductase/glycerate 2-kinase